MKVPGVVYSLILAIAAWAVEYFTTGGGAGLYWAPILLAVVPVVLKLITVQTSDPVAVARGFGAPAESSKMRRFLLG